MKTFWMKSSNLIYEDIPDEVFESNITSEDEVWQMFFDGASRIGPKGRIIAGVGVVFTLHRIMSFLEYFL